MRAILLFGVYVLWAFALSEATGIWDKLQSSNSRSSIEESSEDNSNNNNKSDLIRAKLLEILKKRVGFQGSQRRKSEIGNNDADEQKTRLLMETIRSIEIQRREAESLRKESEMDVRRMKETLEKEKKDLELLNRKRELVSKALRKQAEIARTKKTIIEEALARRNNLKKARERLQEERLLMRQRDLQLRKEKEVERIRQLNLIKKQKKEEIRALQAHKLLARESNERVIQKINDLKSMSFLGGGGGGQGPEVILQEEEREDERLESLLALLSQEGFARRRTTTTPAPSLLTEAEKQKLLTLLDLKKNAWILTKNNQKIAQKFKSENALLSPSPLEDKEVHRDPPETQYDYDEYEDYPSDYLYDYEEPQGELRDLRNHPPNLIPKNRPPQPQEPHSAQPPNLLNQPHRDQISSKIRQVDTLGTQEDFARQAEEFFENAGIATQGYHMKIQKELNNPPRRKKGRRRRKKKRRKGLRPQKNPQLLHRGPPNKRLSFSDLMSDFLDHNPVPFPIH